MITKNRNSPTWKLCVCAFVAFIGSCTVWAGQTETDSLHTRGPQKVVSDPKPATAAPKVSQAAQPKPLDFEVSYVYRPGGTGQPQALVDGSVLRSGDHYKIQFTAQETSYVYIFQVDSSNTVYKLFPMESWGDVVLNHRNPARAGAEYHVPAERKSFALDNQRGSETIYFLAFRKPNAEMENIASKVRAAEVQGNKSLNTAARGQLTKEIRTRGPARIVADPGTKAKVKWNRQETFTMPMQRINKLCADCVNKVTFKHR